MPPAHDTKCRSRPPCGDACAARSHGHGASQAPEPSAQPAPARVFLIAQPPRAAASLRAVRRNSACIAGCR
eukprot:scaffold20523_cov31-Tisochrysis_lutea.AAC.1